MDIGRREVREDEGNGDFSNIIVHGVVWDTDAPYALINNEVYAPKDVLKGTEVRVLTIEENKVTFLSNGEIWEADPSMFAENDSARVY